MLRVENTQRLLKSTCIAYKKRPGIECRSEISGKPLRCFFLRNTLAGIRITPNHKRASTRTFQRRTCFTGEGYLPSSLLYTRVLENQPMYESFLLLVSLKDKYHLSALIILSHIAVNGTGVLTPVPILFFIFFDGVFELPMLWVPPFLYKRKIIRK